MSDTTCPHCGGPIVTYSPICEYCGSAISDTPMIWQRIDHKLPPVDPQNPGRSILVITVNLSDGISFTDKRNGNIINWYDFIDPLLISAYYNFTTKIWSNDLLGKRSGEIKATHWMYIPPISSPLWISVDKSFPEPSDAGKVISIPAVICDQNNKFTQSIITAEWGFDTHSWSCVWLQNANPVEDSYESMIVVATHWMARPAGPTE